MTEMLKSSVETVFIRCLQPTVIRSLGVVICNFKRWSCVKTSMPVLHPHSVLPPISFCTTPSCCAFLEWHRAQPIYVLLHHSILLCLSGVTQSTTHLPPAPLHPAVPFWSDTEHNFTASLLSGCLQAIYQTVNGIHSIITISGLVQLVDTDTSDTTQYQPIPNTSIVCSLVTFVLPLKLDL